MVQLDHEEHEIGRLHGMYGSMEAEFEVQRTTKRVELTPSSACSKKWLDPSRCMSTTKELLTGFGEEKESAIKPRAEDADVWIKIWEELHYLAERGILVEVEHVKAHPTKKEKKEMSHFEKFVTEGNEKADEMAKAGATLDRGFVADARAVTVQERQEVYAALQYAASFHRPEKNGKTVKSSGRNQKKSGISDQK